MNLTFFKEKLQKSRRIFLNDVVQKNCILKHCNKVTFGIAVMFSSNFSLRMIRCVRRLPAIQDNLFRGELTCSTESRFRH